MARVMPICPLCGARGLCPDPTLHERFDALLALHTKLANDLVCPDPKLHQSEPEGHPMLHQSEPEVRAESLARFRRTPVDPMKRSPEGFIAEARSLLAPEESGS